MFKRSGLKIGSVEALVEIFNSANISQNGGIIVIITDGPKRMREKFGSSYANQLLRDIGERIYTLISGYPTTKVFQTAFEEFGNPTTFTIVIRNNENTPHIIRSINGHNKSCEEGLRLSYGVAEIGEGGYQKAYQQARAEAKRKAKPQRKKKA